jgi:hypothetical protein
MFCHFSPSRLYFLPSSFLTKKIKKFRTRNQIKFQNWNIYDLIKFFFIFLYVFVDLDIILADVFWLCPSLISLLSQSLLPLSLFLLFHLLLSLFPFLSDYLSDHSTSIPLHFLFFLSFFSPYPPTPSSLSIPLLPPLLIQPSNQQ